MDNTSHTHPGPASRVRRFRAAAFLLLATALLFSPTTARAQSKEYQVKAVFLLNFAKFTTWPAGAFPDASAPLTIGILGDDPFGGALAAATNGETVGGRKFAIKRGRAAADLKECQLVFVSKSETARLGEIQGAGVLTVGESDAFCSLGGIINFTPQGGTVGFEINTAAAQRAGLGISSKLLKLGKPASAR